MQSLLIVLLARSIAHRNCSQDRRFIGFSGSRFCWGKIPLPKLHCHLLVTMLQYHMVCCCTMIGVDYSASLPLNACYVSALLVQTCFSCMWTWLPSTHASAKLCSCQQAVSDTRIDQTLICKYSICVKSLCKSLMVILQLSLSYTLSYCGYLQVASYRV